MENEKNKGSRIALPTEKGDEYPEEWVGLSSARFRRYRNWINKGKPGICGTYCCAVLVHDAIYQKTNHSLQKETLLKGMKKVVDHFLPYRGTYFWDLAHGLKKILADVPGWKVHTGLLAEKIVPRVLGGKHPVPVIVGTTFLLNSTYKNHWLLVYAYGYNSEGKLFFKAYDNHGRYEAIVPASQTISCVWLEEIEE